MLPKMGHEYLDTVPLESLTTRFLIANFASPCITRANTYKFIFHQPGPPKYQNGQRIGEKKSARKREIDFGKGR
jgi:hypothetical protein